MSELEVGSFIQVRVLPWLFYPDFPKTV